MAAIPSNFTTPIPKNSNFALNDWIIKDYGSYIGKVAQIVGYQKRYYGTGNYLIQFLDGKLYPTKQKYFRGPYKTKEIALQYQSDKTLKDNPEDLRLKPTSIRSNYQTLPKTEEAIKAKYTKEPYNFTWLETPVTVSQQPHSNDVTVLAVREDENSNLRVRDFGLTNNGFNQFAIIRYNSPLTKKLSMSDGSPYQIYYPDQNTLWNSNVHLKLGQPAIEQVNTLYNISKRSYKTAGNPDYKIEAKFRGYNKFISSKKLTSEDLIEAIGGVNYIGNKKILTLPILWEKYGLNDQSLIKNYCYEGIYQFRDHAAVNLNNCPQEADGLQLYGEKLQDLSSNNHPNIKKIQIYVAPLIKSLQGLDTFTGIERVEIAISDNRQNLFESFDRCPSDIDLQVYSDGLIKTLAGLPKTLKTVVVRAQLDNFDCSDTTISGRLVVHNKPNSLEGLPRASEYQITGYSQEEIDEEINFRKLKDKLPELEGIF